MTEAFASVESILENERSGVLGPKWSLPVSGYSNNPRMILPSNDINAKMRIILIDWLFEVCKMFKLLPTSWHATFNIVDAYLARAPNLPRSKLQLVGISSLFIATKFNEIYAPELADLIFISDKAYTGDEIVQMEKEIFTTLGCKVNIPIEINYVRIISLASESDLTIHSMSKNLVTTQFLNSSQFLPSVVVTACVAIICQLYNHPYVNLFNVAQDVISLAMYQIVDFCKRLKKANIQAYKGIAGKQQANAEWLQTFDLICSMYIKAPASIPNAAKYNRNTYFKDDITIPLVPRSTIPKAVAKLGEGTYGIVKKIKYHGTFYAVKKIRSDFAGEGITSSFIREITAGLVMDHPNIARIRHVSDDLNLIFFDLGISDVSKWITKNGPMYFDVQVEFARQMFSALQYIHNMGSLHRDIKPANIIIYTGNGSNKNLPRFVLSDFGLARGPRIALRENPFTHEVITLWYRPPEILLGKAAYGPAIDIWSMLCTIYECAVGKPLFPGNSEIDQLFKIFQILGTPTNETWEDVESLPEYQPTGPKFKAQLDFFNDNRKLSDLYKKLLNESLILDPNKRPSAKELLNTIESTHPKNNTSFTVKRPTRRMNVTIPESAHATFGNNLTFNLITRSGPTHLNIKLN